MKFLLYYIAWLLLFKYGCSDTILHLADFHMDLEYSIHGDNTKMCHEGPNSTRMNLGTYGDYLCDSSEALVKYTLNEAAKLFPSPDIILWTGDNVPHIENYNWTYVYNSMRVATNLIQDHFSINTKTILLPTFGNHDYAPANAYDTYSELYLAVWDMWSKFIGPDQKERFLRGGYYKVVRKGVTFLVLNTNLYYNANEAYVNFTNPDDPAEMFAFMESELEAASKCGNQINKTLCTNHVHIVAHIPPGVFERTPHYNWFRPYYNERFLNITLKYAETIKWMLYGHHHTDTFHLIRDKEGKAVQLSLMAPAVTPWFSSLDGAGANNPAFRIYRTSDDLAIINDIETYYVNLDQLNQGNGTFFQFEYSFQKAYNITGPINALAMDKVIKRMKTDETTLMTYLNYNSVTWNVTKPKGIYLGAQICSIDYSDYPRYDACLLQYKSSNSLSVISVFILSFLIYHISKFS